MRYMVVAELVSQLDMSSLKVLYVEQPPQVLNNFSNPSVTPLVSQPLMSPYVAAAVVGSLHHAPTAVSMLSLVMGVTVVGAGDAVGIELDGEELGAGVVLGDTLGATDEDDSNFRLLSLLRSCP